VKLCLILKWAALAFVVWWVITDTVNAAHLVQNVGDFLTDAAHFLTDAARGLGHFVTSI
jgi:hypothetical protein